MTEQSFHNPESTSASKLFDLRYLIGGLFTLYGVIITIAGLAASSADKHKADGININLWRGIGRLALGLLFLLGAWLRPLRPLRQPSREDEDDGGETHQA